MVHEEVHAVRLLAVLCALCLMVSVFWGDGIVSEAAGDPIKMPNTPFVFYPYSVIQLDLVSPHYYVGNPDDEIVKPVSSSVVYRGDVPIEVQFSGLDVGSIYNGRYRFDVTLNPPSVTSLSLDVMRVSLSDSHFQDGIDVSLLFRGQSTADSPCVVTFDICFDNYVAITDALVFSFLLDVSLGGTYYSQNVVKSSVPISGAPAKNFANSVLVYSDLEDVPSLDGLYAGKLDEIRDRIDNQVIVQNDEQIQEQQHGNKLQEQGNVLQEQENQLQEEANDLQQEANETSKGILGKITDFFNGFFSNLGQTVLGWIVPSADQMTAFFDEVNEWFGDRLGFIWYPFSLAVDLVTALAGGEADTGFVVPALTLDLLGTEYTIYPGGTFDIDSFGIFVYVRYFTSALLVCGVANLAYHKWDEWIGGHGVG